MTTLADINFDAVTHEPLALRAIWNVPNGSSVRVLVLAWSLGATRAYCLLHIDRLEAGNYSACWLPSSQLTIQ